MPNSPKQLLTIHLIIGTVLGFILAALIELHVIHAYIYASISLFGFYYLFANYHSSSIITPVISSIITAAIASLPVYFWQSSANWSNIGSDYNPITMTIAVMSAYAINAFHIASYCKKRWYCYDNLFFAVWDTFIELIIAAFFTSISWGLIFLCAILFKLLKINIYDFIESTWFYAPFSTLMFSLGIYISLSTKNVIRSIRRIIIAICYFLLPILSIISIAFILIWLTSTHALLLTRPGTQWTFLWIAFLSIIFFNGVYQNGDHAKQYPLFFSWVVSIFILITPVFSLLALLTFLHSVQFQYHDHIITLINWGLLITYNLSYAIITSLNQKPWMNAVKQANIFLALLLIIIAFLTNNPWFQQATGHRPNLEQHIKKALSNAKKFEQFRNQLMLAGFSWVPQENGKNMRNTIVIGYNDGPIFLCQDIRTQTIGFVFNTGPCHIIKDKKISTIKQFKLLTGNNEQISWTGGREFLSSYNNSRVFRICRTIYQNRIHVGVIDAFKCRFIDGNQTNTTSYIQYLSYNPPRKKEKNND